MNELKEATQIGLVILVCLIGMYFLLINKYKQDE